MLLKPTRGTQLNKSHPLARELVGCWLYNEGTGNHINDYSGNGYHGTAQSLVLSNWGAGKTGYFLYHDGSNDYTDLGDRQAPQDAVSVIAWVDPSSVSSPAIIFAVNDSEDGEGAVQFNISANSGQLQLRVTDSSTSDNLTRRSDTSAVTTDGWQLLGGVWPGTTSSSDMRLYRNGVRFDTTSADSGSFSAMNTASIDWTIGAQISISHNPANFWPGGIECVMLWNRALSAEEMRSLYMDTYQMFREDDIPAWLYAAAAAGGLSIPVAWHHIARH